MTSPRRTNARSARFCQNDERRTALIRPAKLSNKERIRESTKRMMEIHDETLRKLAK